MRLSRIAVTLIGAGALAAGGATAQTKPDNLGALKQFKVATTDLNIPADSADRPQRRRDP